MRCREISNFARPSLTDVVFIFIRQGSERFTVLRIFTCNKSIVWWNIPDSHRCLSVSDDNSCHNRMENSSQHPQGVHQDSSMPTEGSVLLKSAADAGNWDLVKDVIINGDVTATDVRQSFFLQKLASATGISQQLVRKLLNILFSNQSNYDTLKYVAEEAVVRAAHCDNWDTLVSFLSVSDTLLQDETNLLSVTELMASSDSLKKSRYLQIDVLVCVWRHAKQKILDSTDKRVQNTLVQLAAELNMWSRVCDLLVAKPDLNLLDKDGLSVLHRLVMCPDNRFDSLLPVLLDNGADASLKNSEGDTALHLAVNHQKIGSVGKSLQLEECNVGDPCTDFRSKIMAEYHLKCSESKKQALVKLVESCPNLDSLDSLGNTAVILAAKNENWEFLELLMEHGASTDLVDDNWRSVVHVLALTGGQMDPQLVTKVVEQCQCQLDDTDLSGSSPLHLAAHSQNWTVFKVLLHFGADPGMRDGAGYTVLHTLASTGKDQVQHVTSLFTLLTQQGVDVNIPCPAGNTVLHIAAMQKNWTLVKHLIHSGVDVQHCNTQGYSVMHLLAFSNPHSQESNEGAPDESGDGDLDTFISLLVLFLNKRADATFSTGDTILNVAARHENWTVVNYLIQHGADIKELEEERICVIEKLIQSPAETQNIVDIFNLLMTHVAKNMRFSCGDSILQLSAKHEKWSFVDYILTRHGGDVDEPDNQGFSILHRMALSTGKTFKGNFSKVKSLLRKSVFLNSKNKYTFLILEAAAARNVDIVEALLDNLDDVNTTDYQGFTVLHRVAQCCVSQSVAIVRRLVEKGADVNKKCPNGNTAIHLAAKSNNWLIIQHLLRHGASTQNLDDEGMSVLHRLIAQPCLQCQKCCNGPPAKRPVCLLGAILDNGASIGQKDCNNNSPLHLAIKYEHWDIAIELMSRGARLNEPDAEGCTVLHILAKRNNSIRDEMALERNCVACCLESYQNSKFYFLFSTLAKQNINHLDMCNAIIDHANIIDSLDHHGNTALILSAKYNNLDITEQLLTKGAKPGLVNRYGLSTLHTLAIAKHSTCGDLQNKIVKRLISRRVDTKALDPEGNTPIQVAAKHGNMDMVEQLLEFQDNVNETDSEGFTLLSRVAQTSSSRCENIARRLLIRGADGNRTCPDGKSPLQLSVIARNWPVTLQLWHSTSRNNMDIVLQEQYIILHRLIEGVNLRTFTLIDLAQKAINSNKDTLMHRSPDGATALQLAIIERKWSLAALILERCEYSDIESLAGSSVFHVFAEIVSHMSNLKLIVSLMPNKNLNINLRDDNGNTPLNILANNNCWSFIKPFVEHGADVNIPDSEGWTILHKLARTGWNSSSDILIALVKYGADIDKSGPGDKTAVMLALEKGNWAVLWQLLQLGASYDWNLTKKCLLLSSLCHFPKRDLQVEKLRKIVGYLTQPSVNCSLGANIPSQAQESLKEGARCSESTVAQQHLQSGADVTRFQSSFEKCVRFSNWAVANELLLSCPHIDIKKLICGKPLIHVMVTLHQEDDHVIWVSFLTELLHRGLDINSRDERGRTVLMKHKALFSFPDNDTKTLYGVLLEKGVNPSLVDKTGNSLLTLLMKYDLLSLEMVKVLIKVGVLFCQPQFEDGVTKDPLQISHSLYFSQLKQVMHVMESAVVKILVECGAISNSDLFLLKTAFQRDEIQDSDDESINSEAEGVLQIVEEAATQPRSLESLCRLSVSRSLPRGVNRSDAVMSLPIPTLIKDYLLFTDEVSLLNSSSENAGWDPWFEYDTDDEDDFYFFDEDETDEEINTEVDDDDE